MAATLLGIPWKISKDVPFSTCFPFTGLTWNLQTWEVSLLAQKCNKYRVSIEAWQVKPRHILLEVQKLYGRLLHSTHVIPMDRAYLTNLETMLAICHDHPYMPHSSPTQLQLTLNGGHSSSANLSPEKYLDPARSSTLLPTLMPVQVSVLESLSDLTGVPEIAPRMELRQTAGHPMG